MGSLLREIQVAAAARGTAKRSELGKVVWKPAVRAKMLYA